MDRYSFKFLSTDHHDTAPVKTAALCSKFKFETFAKEYNMIIKHMHSNNGVFTSKAFIDRCIPSLQGHTLCGVTSARLLLPNFGHLL